MGLRSVDLTNPAKSAGEGRPGQMLRVSLSQERGRCRGHIAELATTRERKGTATRAKFLGALPQAHREGPSEAKGR